jgi:tRNA(His) guanylyltransferase
MKDSLGDRMKANYEDRFRILLPRRTNLILRIDGKAFHTYTRGFNKPFDDGLIEDMDKTAIALCRGIQGAKLAYVQSDEISVWVTDYDGLETSAWFDNNLQKMVSVSASIATAAFNRERTLRNIGKGGGDFCIDARDDIPQFASFDARVFVIPEVAEVANYFLWRCQDATRNSVQMVARSLYSHKECEGKNIDQLKEMITKAKSGDHWVTLDCKYRHGRYIQKTPFPAQFTESHDWTAQGVDQCLFEYWNLLVKSNLPKSTT